MDKPVDFYWWDGAEIADWIARIGRLGSENVKIRFYPPDSKHEKRGLLQMVPKASVTASSHEGGNGNGEECDDDCTNFTHTCPLDCP